MQVVSAFCCVTTFKRLCTDPVIEGIKPIDPKLPAFTDSF